MAYRPNWSSMKMSSAPSPAPSRSSTGRGKGGGQSFNDLMSNPAESGAQTCDCPPTLQHCGEPTIYWVSKAGEGCHKCSVCSAFICKCSAVVRCDCKMVCVTHGPLIAQKRQKDGRIYFSCPVPKDEPKCKDFGFAWCSCKTPGGTSSSRGRGRGRTRETKSAPFANPSVAPRGKAPSAGRGRGGGGPKTGSVQDRYRNHYAAPSVAPDLDEDDQAEMDRAPRRSTRNASPAPRRSNGRPTVRSDSPPVAEEGTEGEFRDMTDPPANDEDNQETYID